MEYFSQAHNKAFNLTLHATLRFWGGFATVLQNSTPHAVQVITALVVQPPAMTKRLPTAHWPDSPLITKPGLPPGVVTALMLSLSLPQRFPVPESHQIEDGVETEG